MKRLAPGVYDDELGGLHLDVEELLAAHGLPNTRANQQLVVAAARQFDWGARVPVTETTEPIRRDDVS